MFETKFQALLFAVMAATPLSVMGSCWVQRQPTVIVESSPKPVVAEVPQTSTEGTSLEYFITQYDNYARVTLKVRSYKAFIDNVKDKNVKPKLREDLAKFSADCDLIVTNYNAEALNIGDRLVAAKLPKSLASEACK